MDTVYYLVQNMLPVAVALLVVALGGMFSERSGVVNIALEGIMLFGGFFAALFVFFVQGSGMNVQVILLIGLIIAGTSGVLYSMLLAFSAVNMKSNQVISGTALNMFIPAMVILFSRMYFGENGVTTNISLYIRRVPLLADIPVLGDLFFQNTYLTVYVGIAILIIASIVLYKTKFGLRLRSCGEHPHAADSVGISVSRMRYWGVAISGLLAGIGGYFYAIGVLDANINGRDGVNGYGFLALAVMIFGQWKPMRILFGALLFAFLNVLGSSVILIPWLNNLNIDTTFYQILPYLTTLVVLIFTSAKSNAPKAEGIPFEKGTR